jgi:23S rRNA pseudouridine1911/1915/1917 synthase
MPAREAWTVCVDAASAGTRLDKFLTAAAPELSRARWQQLIEAGDVQVNGKASKANHALHAGDVVAATLPPPVAAAPAAQAIALEVVFENADVVVVNKPAGLVVHPGAGNQTGTLVNALLYHCKDLSGIGGVLRPGIVHRIDKDTSGLLVAAKHDAAHRALAMQFEAHTIERAYEALAWGGFRARSGTIRGTLERDPRNRLRMTGRTGAGRAAVTHYAVTGETPHFARLTCRLETGRTHQIRVHLAEAGHPIVGDPVYGNTRSVSPRMGVNLQQAVKGFGRQALHAAVLGFTGLDGARLRFERPMPPDMQALWARMEAEDAA